MAGKQIGKANRLTGQPCPYCGATLPAKGRVMAVELDDDGTVLSSVPGPPPPWWEQISKNAPLIAVFLVAVFLLWYFSGAG